MNDNDLDRRLTEYGDRWRTTQPGPPMPDLPSTSPLRRWLPVVAVAAAAALIAVGVTAALKATGGDEQGQPATGITPVDLTGAIPWIDTPASPPAGPSPAPCTSSDVTMRPSGTDGAAGHSSTTCASRT